MLYTKSHVYVDKVTTWCALNHIYMSPRLLNNMYVLSSVVGDGCPETDEQACRCDRVL